MRRILVAIDGSNAAYRALDFAVSQARCEPAAELRLLNVQPLQGSYTTAEIYLTGERLRSLAAEKARTILDAAKERLRDAPCRYEVEQLEGDPAETIARRAAELECESITMGTHGLGSIGILFLGSIAQKVVYYASVPVTLVK